MRKPLLLPFSQLLPVVLFLRAVLSRGNGTNSSSEFHRQATVKEKEKKGKKEREKKNHRQFNCANFDARSRAANFRNYRRNFRGCPREMVRTKKKREKVKKEKKRETKRTDAPSLETSHP